MQKRWHSLAEQILNTGSGFLISIWFFQLVIVPLWGFQTTVVDDVSIAMFFLITGICRGYLWRRFFDGRIGLQSKHHSAIEQFINVGSGFIINTLVWTFVITTLWGFETTFLDNLGVNALFFVINYIRSYYWRRIFNYITQRHLPTVQES